MSSSYRNKLQNKCIEVSGPWQLSLLYLVCRSASRTPEDRKDRQAWVELNIRKSELPSGGWWCHAVSGRSRSCLLSSCEASVWEEIRLLAAGSDQINLNYSMENKISRKERPFDIWLIWTRFTQHKSGPGSGSAMGKERDHWRAAITKYSAGLTLIRWRRDELLEKLIVIFFYFGELESFCWRLMQL